MRIVVNGEDRDVPQGTSVRQLIEQLTPKGAACAAEVNRELVPRREQEGRTLREGDRVEIVTLVGGG
jgi:sulfur carrier protein